MLIENQIPIRHSYDFCECYIAPKQVFIHKDSKVIKLEGFFALTWNYIDGKRPLNIIQTELDLTENDLSEIIKTLIKSDLIGLNE